MPSLSGFTILDLTRLLPGGRSLANIAGENHGVRMALVDQLDHSRKLARCIDRLTGFGRALQAEMRVANLGNDNRL